MIRYLKQNINESYNQVRPAGISKLTASVPRLARLFVRQLTDSKLGSIRLRILRAFARNFFEQNEWLIAYSCAKAPLCEAQSFPKGKVRICEYNADSVLRSYPFWEKDSQNLGCSPRSKEGSERECARDSRREFFGAGKKKNKIKNRKSNWKLSQSFLFFIDRPSPKRSTIRHPPQAEYKCAWPSPSEYRRTIPPIRTHNFCFLYKTSEYSE